MRTLTLAKPATATIGLEPRGYVHISGHFANAHRGEIEALLRAEEQRAHGSSPQARVLGWDDDGSGGLLMTTTTEHLAHRLGRSLQKAHGGELHHGFFRDNKLAFVWWRP